MRKEGFCDKVIRSGSRSGSDKVVHEFYDELIKIWCGPAPIKPLSFGIDTETLSDHDNPENAHLQQSLLPSDDEILCVD